MTSAWPLFNLLFIMQLYQREDVTQCLKISRKSLNGKFNFFFGKSKLLNRKNFGKSEQ